MTEDDYFDQKAQGLVSLIRYYARNSNAPETRGVKEISDALRTERRLGRQDQIEPSLREVAESIMLHCNESPECPLCGIDDGEHEVGERCDQLDIALSGPRKGRDAK